MSPRPLPIAASLFLLAGCGEPDHDHDHAHATGDGHDAKDGHHDAAPATASPDTAVAATPADFSLGPWTAQLETTAEVLRLTAKSAAGAVVTPSGEARVVLTGTGEEEQRVVLAAAVGGWSGSARAAGARGYVAVVSVEIDGRTETARVTWGEVPVVTPAPKAEEASEHDADHDDGHDHGNGHDH